MQEIHLALYAGFMRCDELVKLQCKGIVFSEESMVVNVCSSKTDQFREGASLVIACSRELTCPVDMMQRYCTMAKIDLTSDAMLFRGIVSVKEGEQLRAKGGLSYSRLRELLLAKIAQMGWDPKLYGMHSLKAGGATAAANAGVLDRLFKRHGRWKSESAKDGYVKDSLESRLTVSKSLGV